jgi:uncharacterized membrane protein (DUF2068 family)
MQATGTPGRGLWLIAAFKLVKGFALLGLGIGVVQLLHKDVASLVEHWINVFRVDPHNHFINLLLVKLSILDDRRLKELSIGTFIYSAIFFAEGIGLALEKRWAEYFTVITTASFFPLEVYELAKRVSFGTGFALFVNLAVVAYLIRELLVILKSADGIPLASADKTSHGQIGRPCWMVARPDFIVCGDFQGRVSVFPSRTATAVSVP